MTKFFCLFFLVFNSKQHLTGHRIIKFGYETKFSICITTVTGNSSVCSDFIRISEIGLEAFNPSRLLTAFKQSYFILIQLKHIYPSISVSQQPLIHCMGSDSSVIGLGEKLLVSSKISSFNFSFGKSSSSISNLNGSSATGSSAGS